MKLTKKAYQTIEADKLIDRSFNELKSTTEGVSLTNFLKYIISYFLQYHKQELYPILLYLIEVENIYKTLDYHQIEPLGI